MVRRHADRNGIRERVSSSVCPGLLCSWFPLSPNVRSPNSGPNHYGSAPPSFPNSNARVWKGLWPAWGQFGPVECLSRLQAPGVLRRWQGIWPHNSVHGPPGLLLQAALVGQQSPSEGTHLSRHLSHRPLEENVLESWDPHQHLDRLYSIIPSAKLLFTRQAHFWGDMQIQSWGHAITEAPVQSKQQSHWLSAGSFLIESL